MSRCGPNAQRAIIMPIMLLLTVTAFVSSTWLSNVFAGKSEEKVIAVGLDSMGKSVTAVIPATDYRRNLALAFGSVHDSILPVLNQQKNQTAAKPLGLGWHLNSIGVGVGIAGQFGLGPIIHISPSAQIKLVFTNSLSPVYPD